MKTISKTVFLQMSVVVLLLSITGISNGQLFCTDAEAVSEYLSEIKEGG